MPPFGNSLRIIVRRQAAALNGDIASVPLRKVPAWHSDLPPNAPSPAPGSGTPKHPIFCFCAAMLPAVVVFACKKSREKSTEELSEEESSEEALRALAHRRPI